MSNGIDIYHQSIANIEKPITINSVMGENYTLKVLFTRL